MSRREILYLTAYDITEKSRSYILKSFNLEQSEQLRAVSGSDSEGMRNIERLLNRLADLEAFGNKLTGEGFMICLSRLADSYEDTGELFFHIGELENCKRIYEALWIGEIYPLSEGEFVPGIYEIDDRRFFEIRNEPAFSELYLNNFSGDFMSVRFSFSDYGVTVFSSENGEENKLESVRLPFTYFDVKCPFCRKVVVSYKHRSQQDKECKIVKIACPHFIGNIIKWNDRFISERLDDLDYNYRLANNAKDLFLETSPGFWQQTVLHNIEENRKKSYWTKDDYFVFAKDIPNYSLRNKYSFIKEDSSIISGKKN